MVEFKDVAHELHELTRISRKKDACCHAIMHPCRLTGQWPVDSSCLGG